MVEHAAFQDPALTIALAAASGMVAQVAARHVRVPGIVLLLGTGLLLGPDGLGAVQPATLGASLHSLVGFAVAVILFEGGMNLNAERLRREARSIRQLITLGALVTAVGGALAARIILRWDWEIAILFGTLVMVTGPTVITPLLRRIKVKERVATVLEAEGILVDAVGAITAVVALEVVISPDRLSFAAGAWPLLTRLGTGALLGVVGGLVIAALLRIERVVPEGLESALTLALAIALFQGSNALMPETGILSVIVAGIVVGNSSSRVLDELREFKERLTVLLLGMLFVLLAADVRVAQLQSLGWAGVATVLALTFIVRPLNILAGTLGSDLTWRANGLARAVGRALRLAGEEVVFIDSNQEACNAAEEEGFRTLHGSGLEPNVQEEAELDTRAGCLGLTSNEEVNLLFARRCRKDFKVPRVWVAVRRAHVGVSQEVVQRLGGHLLFGEPEEIVAWMNRLESGEARVEPWIKTTAASFNGHLPDLDGLLLPLVVQRGKRAFPVDERVTFRPGDRLFAALDEERRQEIAARLQQAGWEWASSASVQARM